MTIPTISVLIVNYNTRSFLEKCLKSILSAKGRLTIEVFVIDNNSTDDSADMVETMFPDIHLMRYPQNVGFTKAVNEALPLAKGKYYLLLHPDLELLPETLHNFIKFFESHPKAGILGGNLYYPDGTPNPCEILFPSFKNDLLCLFLRLFRRLPGGRCLTGDHNPLEWSHKSTSKVNWVWNACMMVRREVLERVGYFDEDFFVWYADWDICKRAADLGWSIYYVFEAKAIHHERQSFSKEDIPREEVCYKVDGWCSVTQQAQDRHIFLKKHGKPTSICGVKTVSILENMLRLWFVLCSLLFRKANYREANFQLRTCIRTIRTILSA